MTAASADDLRWLDAAARYAAPHVGGTAENPAVAALVVDTEKGILVSRAVTARGGRPHAAAQALDTAGFEAAGRTLYTTLEPCHHWGRTPPCVDAVVRSGVMRVVIGALDPDPRTGGLSIAKLESAGIEVIVVDHAPSRALHAGHVLRHTAQRPQVTALLGDFAGHVAWRDIQRARADAILLDAGTARNGADPFVTTPGLQHRTPLRIVLAGVTGVDRSLNLIARFSGYRTAIIAETGAPVSVPASVEVIRVAGTHGRPDLVQAFEVLAQRGVQHVVVEAGPRLIDQLIERELLDRLALADGPIPAGVAGTKLVEVEPHAGLRIFERPV